MASAVPGPAVNSFAPRIFTVGHSNHEVKPFFALLARYGVRALVDVRSIPSSGRFPHFKRRSLETLSRQHGVSYRHCPELGNKLDGGIAHLLRQPEGQAALAELEAAATRAAPGPAWEAGHAPEGATAYMCAEADWRDCHRQVIAQQLLFTYNVRTTHILRDGNTEEHPVDYATPPHYGMEPTASVACCLEDDEVLALQLAQLQIGEGTRDELESSVPQIAGARRWGAAEESPPSSNTAGDAAQPRSRRWGKKTFMPSHAESSCCNAAIPP